MPSTVQDAGDTAADKVSPLFFTFWWGEDPSRRFIVTSRNKNKLLLEQGDRVKWKILTMRETWAHLRPKEGRGEKMHKDQRINRSQRAGGAVGILPAHSKGSYGSW